VKLMGLFSVYWYKLVCGTGGFPTLSTQRRDDATNGYKNGKAIVHEMHEKHEQNQNAKPHC